MSSCLGCNPIWSYRRKLPLRFCIYMCRASGITLTM
uniref:Uncharacterized protein n=1 Tax=Arundo donax TaxID=35708 RepID=A0A0A8Z7T5_ARUDO